MDNRSSISKMVLIVPILFLAISGTASSMSESNPEMEKMVSAIIEEPLLGVAAYLRRQQEEGIIKCKAHGQYCTVGKEYECCAGTKCIHYNMSWGLCINT
ncbi:unnamed protein product [Amaranthus hypochondriacus]